MWSLFPPTSSSNLNNNVYLPHPPTPAPRYTSRAAPGIRGARERWRGARTVRRVAGVGGVSVRRAPGSLRLRSGPAPRSSAPAAARRGSARGGSGRGAGGWARAGPLAAPARVAASPATPPPRTPRPRSRSRASPAYAPRVTSGQIQRDVLLAAVIPPCAKQDTHTHKHPS